jgi:hypothetical protein
MSVKVGTRREQIADHGEQLDRIAQLMRTGLERRRTCAPALADPGRR